MAGRNVGVVGSATRPGFCPAMIEAFQHVTIANLLRRYKTQTRIAEFEMHMSGLDAKARVCSALKVCGMPGLGNVVNSEALQSNSRRHGVDREMRRSHFDQALGRREPQVPVVRAPGGRMAIGGRLAAAQPVRGAKLQPV